MLKRRILYFICLAVVFGVNIFYVEYQIFILLVLMIAIPLVSWIMYAISDVSLGLSLQVNKNVVHALAANDLCTQQPQAFFFI